MTYKELEKYLEENGNKKFAEFSKTISNSEYLVFGVKNPVLRQIVKEHIKDEESGGFGSKQIYCQALDISRTLFYKFVRDKEKTEK